MAVSELDTPKAGQKSESSRRVARRHAADRRLRIYGLTAILLAAGLLGILVTSLVATGHHAFVQTKVQMEVYLDPDVLDPETPQRGNYRNLVRDSFYTLFEGSIPKEDKRAVGESSARARTTWCVSAWSPIPR